MRLTEEDGGPPAAFFESLQEGFQRAARDAGGTTDRFYSVGGLRIRLSFAGSALLPLLTPALEHLATAPGIAPALTICLWDSASTGTSRTIIPWPPESRRPRGEIDGYSNERFFTAHHGGYGALSMVDAEQGRAVYWISDAASLPSHESGAPLRTILHWWLGRRGRQVVHAGAVGTETGGVLLVGKGGSGKSTTVLACLGSALRYAGDDYCSFRLSPTPYVDSLYSSGKVNAGDASRFPCLEPALSNRGRLDYEKALYFLAGLVPEVLSTGFALRALLLPRVAGGLETRATPVAPAAGLRALAPSTIFQTPGAGEPDFRRLSALVAQVPCYELALGTNLAAIPDVILGVLAEI